MENHFKLSDAEFAARFADCSLSPADFTHVAHLRLAWILLDRYGPAPAEQLLQEQLQQFVLAAGARDKYHATLTVAATKAFHHFMSRATADNFRDFLQEFPQLKDNFRELLECHYGFDLFACRRAKAEYVAPDLLPFD